MGRKTFDTHSCFEVNNIGKHCPC